MITVTNNATQFFEENKELEVIIYGAGNAGKWVGFFMKLVGIDFSCYFDRDVRKEGSLLNGRPIVKPDKLVDYRGKSIKLIVCPVCYKEICSDLLWLDRKYGFNALCFVPQYTDFMHHDDRYNINKFLGYFRRQLVTCDAPLIISNDCTAGFLYEALGMLMLSPTINSGFDTESFMKLCRDPQKYLSENVADLKWIRRYDQQYHPVDSPAGRLDDITILFGHASKLEGITEKWMIMSQNIKWNKIVFVMQDGHETVSLETLKEFDSLKEKHLFVSMRSHYGYISENIVYFKDNWFHNRNCVIENNFDLIEWINRS